MAGAKITSSNGPCALLQPGIARVYYLPRMWCRDAAPTSACRRALTACRTSLCVILPPSHSSDSFLSVLYTTSKAGEARNRGEPAHKVTRGRGSRLSYAIRGSCAKMLGCQYPEWRIRRSLQDKGENNRRSQVQSIQQPSETAASRVPGSGIVQKRKALWFAFRHAGRHATCATGALFLCYVKHIWGWSEPATANRDSRVNQHQIWKDHYKQKPFYIELRLCRLPDAISQYNFLRFKSRPSAMHNFSQSSSTRLHLSKVRVFIVSLSLS